MKQVDFLVIGSGVAGLSFALKAANYGTVNIITKSKEDESNTKYAQCGIAVVIDGKLDSFEKHIKDTLIAGDGLCNKDIVEIVIKEGPNCINEIIKYGANFDRNSQGEYDLAREGGHSEHRVLHHKDVTGYEIERSLLKKIHEHPNIEILDHHFAIELLTQHHLNIDIEDNIECYGAYVLNIHTGKIERVLSKITLMATGGAGNIYQSTTNPIIATGDGIAMVYRAKGKVDNMEFIQFHPTSLYNPDESPAFLISEAVRGDGGILKNKKGEEFMHLYDERKSLAPRDIVARAIDAEMKKSGDEHVFLDVTHIPKEDLLRHFPNIYAKCLSIGIDMSKSMIPVLPSAHYMCGGIVTDRDGKTSINNLYACGECSSTGLHGANRLASNSLLEALVFANRSLNSALKEIKNKEFNYNIPDWNDKNTVASNEDILVTHNIKELQRLMSDYVGIVRSNFRLERASRRLEMLIDETETFFKQTKISVKLCELRNMLLVASLVVRDAKKRKESIGLHYNTDYKK